jgi:hypothetical protein
VSLHVYHQVQRAKISPAPLKFVAATLALCAGDDDGGRIFPSLTTLAGYCSLSRDQVRRHVDALLNAGLLEVVRRATPRTSTEYRMNLQRLAALPRSLKEPARRGSTDAPSEVAPMPPQGWHGRPSEVAPMPPYPPESPEGLEGGGRAANADGGRAPAAAAAPLRFPAVGRRELWAKLHMLRKPRVTQLDFDVWGEQAQVARADGFDVDAGIQGLIDEPGWRLFPRLGGPKPPRVDKPRRKTPVKFPKNTRAPGRTYD